MAITWVREQKHKRGSRKEQTRTVYFREFLVLSDDRTETEDAVRTATGVPRVYEQHPTNAGARVEDVDAQLDQDSEFLWRARVNYSSSVVPAESESPLDRPKDVRWTYTPTTEIVEKAYDAQGNLTIPVRNSALMPFVPAPEKTRGIPTLHIARYQSDFDPDTPTEYEDTVNSDTFFGAPPGLAKYINAEATLIYESTGNIWRVEYTFQFQRKGWVLSLADMGLYELSHIDISGIPVYLPIKQRDINGKKLMDDVVSPVFLNGAGRQAINGQMNYLDFKIYKPKAYAPLGLE